MDLWIFGRKYGRIGNSGDDRKAKLMGNLLNGYRGLRVEAAIGRERHAPDLARSTVCGCNTKENIPIQSIPAPHLAGFLENWEGR
jgi:hypothetical protein